MLISRIALASEFSGWPFELPVVQCLRGEGLAFRKPITILVGENGAGKSTLIEAIAEAYGLDVRGGHGNRRYAVAVPKGRLGQALTLDRAQGVSRLGTHGFFLRSETALGVLSYMSDNGVPGYGDRHLAEVSHGESYLQVLRERFGRPGLYLLDEPEAGLSFQSTLALVNALLDTAHAGGQVICATHSPIVAATPGAQILVASGHGVRPAAWDDLEMVRDWMALLADPGSQIGRASRN